MPPPSKPPLDFPPENGNAGSLPSTVRTLNDVARLERAARRHDVPCGDGVMVWRSWGEGLPVVLLHGGSGSWTHWVRNITALVGAGRRAWIPDLPGFGDSARPPAATMRMRCPPR